MNISIPRDISNWDKGFKDKILMATSRPIWGSEALYTTPMAPRPSSSTMSYRPIFFMDANEFLIWLRQFSAD